MSRPRRASKAPTRFDEVDDEPDEVPSKRAKRAGGSGKKPPSSDNFGGGQSQPGGGAGAGAGAGSTAVGGSLAAAVAASPAAMTASDREAVLSLLGIGSFGSPKRTPPGRELFPKGAAAAGGAGAAFSGGSPGSGSRKRAAGAGAVARPVKLSKSANSTPKKSTPKTKAGKNTPKGKTPKTTPKSTGTKPRGRSAGKGTPSRGTPRGGKAALAEVPITKQMVELSVQLGKLVRNPLALKWCSFEHFYSSLDRYVMAMLPILPTERHRTPIQTHTPPMASIMCCSFPS